MVTVGTALLVAAGLAYPGAAAEAPKGGTLRLAMVVDVDFVDPALAYSVFAWPIGFATCAKLFNYPDASGAAGTQLIPEVVRDFRVSRDGRVYTFELKRTFGFHTGAAVTARSFAAAFNRVANPRLGSPATTYMREIAGAVAVMEGKAQAISGVRVLGRYRLQIRLTRPVGDFTARLTLPFFCPILPNTPVDPAGMSNPPGSGPYYVAERVVNRRIVLKRNPHYRGRRPANVDQVVWAIGGSQEACLLAVEQNRLDHCFLYVPTPILRRLVEQHGINRPGGQFFVSPSLSTWFVAFNHDRRAFKGPGQIPLKKAINHAIDRPELARAFGYLGARRTDQLLPPALGRNERIYPLAGADPATARKWLARAKEKPRTLVLYTLNSAFGVAVARTLEFNLKQLGIGLEVKYYNSPTLAEKAGTRGEPYDLALNGWAIDYADPAGFFGKLLADLHASGNWNFSYFEDPSVSARITAANGLRGEARRNAWAGLDVDLMRNDPPWAPFSNVMARTFVSPSYGCVVRHPVYGIDIAAACKK
jgi:ABC-type oligopeptide transport system substrate-binding subunit